MADVLNSTAPALSATSDMPGAPAPEAPPAPPPTDTTPPTPPPAAADAPPVEPQAEPAKPKEPIRERISDLVRQRREAEANAARFEAVVMQQGEQIKQILEAMNRSAPAAPPAPPPSTGDFTESRPARDAFATPEEHEEALVTWAGRRAAAEATAEMRRQQAEADSARAEAERKATEEKEKRERDQAERAQVNQLQESWEERAETARQRYEDFDDVTQNPSLTIPIGSPMAYAILTREDGAEIAYYLGKHPEEAAKIARMVIPGQVFPAGSPQAGLPVWDGVAQVYELGRIAAKLGTPASPPPLTTETVEETPAVPVTTVITSPPPPPNPLTGGSAVATERSPEDMSMEEYAARRRPQLLAERRPGRTLQ